MVELSVHARLICEALTAVAVNPPGAAGGGTVPEPITATVPLMFKAVVSQARPSASGGRFNVLNEPA